MRKGKTPTRPKAKHHTPAERLEMRRKKRRSGPSGLRRQARRAPLREAARLKEEARQAEIHQAEVDRQASQDMVTVISTEDNTPDFVTEGTSDGH
jgi:hypothetical protein